MRRVGTRTLREARLLAQAGKPYLSLPKLLGKHLCVVVKILVDDAFVVTAFLTDRVKKGTLLWPKES